MDHESKCAIIHHADAEGHVTYRLVNEGDGLLFVFSLTVMRFDGISCSCLRDSPLTETVFEQPMT